MTLDRLIEKSTLLTSKEVDRLKSAWSQDDIRGEAEAAWASVMVSATDRERKALSERIWNEVPRDVWGPVYTAAVALTCRAWIGEENFRAMYGMWSAAVEW